MLNLTALADVLKEKTAWQLTPSEVTDDQYLAMILRGLRRLFIDTGRAAEFDVMKLIMLDNNTYNYDGTFLIDEEEYILCCAEIDFFKKVQSDVNNAFGYSTDALTVTNADKPYANLKNTIDDIDNERRIIYYKMVRYTI